MITSYIGKEYGHRGVRAKIVSKQHEDEVQPEVIKYYAGSDPGLAATEPKRTDGYRANEV
jgi:hypothetical protein